MKMSEELKDKVVQLVETFDVRIALNALHYASRLVKHRISVVERSQPDKLWVAGISGEPTEYERVLGKGIIQFIEQQIQQTVDSWSEETISQVIDILGKSAASFMRKSWGEHELRQATDYRAFCHEMPTVTDPAVEFTALLDRESAKSKVEAIVSTLPQRAKLLVEMRLVQELSWEECASALGITVTATRQLWYRTLRSLRNQLAHGE
jgi:DNA-directed RNA polymerase specialized sigma subunit